VETPTPPSGAALAHLAASKRGLQNGLFCKPRTLILMLDETIICEPPPLYSCYCRIGEQARIPITGNRAKRILHGAINIKSGAVLLLITEVWNEQTHQYFLKMIRSHWRGWHIVLFEDRGSPHTAEDSRELAADLGIQIRLLPRATPELNAMDHLWRQVKRWALSDRPTQSIDKSADDACRYILEMSPRERLQKAGVFSAGFWLAS
jgi:transposase